MQEVADGVTLRPGHATTLNKKTRISNTQRDIIDVCAPLVEQSPGGYLEIVHASAREFLLHPKSGPFVKIAQVHFDIAYACVLNLTSAFIVLPFFSPETTLEDIESLMIQGFFGLHAYADDHWAHHIIEYFQKISGFEGSVPPGCDTTIMMELLESFSRARRGYPGPNSADEPPRPSSVSTAHMQLLQASHISSLVNDWTAFRSRMTGMETSTESIEVQVEGQLRQDPTFLTLITHNIRSIKERLIRIDPNNLPHHINKEDFASFRKGLGVELFECRYGSCNHFSSTLQQRLAHEKSHSPSFLCLYCDLSGTGFRSRRDLERHVRDYHRTDEETAIPDSLESIFERGQNLINAPRTLYHGSLPFRVSSRWNEKGLKALNSTFRQIHKALALHEPTLVEKGGVNVSSESREDVASPTTALSILNDIERKIDKGAYQTLKDFKTDAKYFSSSIHPRESVDDGVIIENMFDKALNEALNGYPGFACCKGQDSLQHDIDPRISTELETSFHSDHSLVSPGSSANTNSLSPRVLKPVFWSKLEESELPGLLGKYGRDFMQIADFLKTKTPEDIEERFRLLVSSGRQDLAELVSFAEARLCEEQYEDNAILVDTNANGLSASGPINEAAKAAEFPDERCSREQSTSPAINIPDAAAAVPYLALSEAAPEYLYHGVSNAPRTSKRMQLDQGPEDGKRPKKRPPPPAAYCHQCPNGPLKLRDDHTLVKHNSRFHSPFRKVWICIDVSLDKNMLAKCPSCRSGVRYGAKHNAAAHLRNKHFGPEASMETLKRWMEEIKEPNPNHSSTQVDSTAADDKSQTLPSISFWSAPEEEPTSESGEETRSKMVPLLEVSFDDILQGYSGRTTPDGTSTPRPSQERLINSSIPHLAHQGLIRVDQVDRLPNLSGPRKAVTRDQVVAYYHALGELPVRSKKYEDALANLKGLSQRLLRDLRDWRGYAPEIRPSF